MESMYLCHVCYAKCSGEHISPTGPNEDIVKRTKELLKDSSLSFYSPIFGGYTFYLCDKHFKESKMEGT